MARGFGKIKGLGNKIKGQITTKRVGKGEKIEDEVITPSSSPTPTADVLNPPQEVVAAPENTDADEVLNDILEDLNIKDMVAVVAEKSDTVSEYSGGSAKSVESEDSEDSDDDGEDDDDDDDDEEETDDEETQASGSKKMGDRFSTVLAAADEIRKKRAGTPESEGTKDVTEATPHTEPGSHVNPPAMEEMEVSKSATQEKTVASKSTKKSRASKAGSRSSSKSPPNGRKSPLTKSKAGRKSPTKSIDGLPPKPQNRRSKRSKTPEFSPEITSNPSAKSSGDDYDDQTKGTMDTGSYDENTLGSGTLGTLGTDGISYEENRCESGELSLDRSQDELRDTKRTVMNKDVIIHQPGGPSGLVVRAMYYTPLPASPEDVIVKVEVSFPSLGVLEQMP